ncbi:unnamed protein product, partial [marine sediment metagenome]
TLDVTSMFTIILNLILFIFFFSTGLEITREDERVIGFVFIVFSGILFISMTTMAILTDLLHAVYVIPFLDPIGAYIIVYGVYKIAGKMNEEKED